MPRRGLQSHCDFGLSFPHSIKTSGVYVLRSMSLFAQLGHSDIWSISGISFASPLNDILDKESFTLEELLQEDELLQEIKGRNSRLIEFLTRDDIVEKILDYVISSPVDLRSRTREEIKSMLVERQLSTEGNRYEIVQRLSDAINVEQEGLDDFGRYKYPYMSCEVFCCEIPQILAKFEKNKDGSTSTLLTKLFSVLDKEAPLDKYLAGYFEKIVDMLFRKMTPTMMAFVNENDGLVDDFMKHMDNYSTLQILQRLMLPHIPFNMQSADLDVVESEEVAKCEWSKHQRTCDKLIDKMLQSPSSGNVSTHVCALIVTVLQISPLEAPFLTNLCNGSCTEKLLRGALADGQDDNVTNAALTVLCVFIQRLCEAMNPDMEFEYGGDIGVFARPPPFVAPEAMKTCVRAMCDTVRPFADQFATQLKSYVDSTPSGTLILQPREAFPRLGTRGINLVKLVEVLFRLEDSDLDKILLERGVLIACVDMMFKYELNSILHLSVQKIVLTILEGDEGRKAAQEHLLNDTVLLEKVMELIQEASTPADPSLDAPSGLRRGPSNLAGARRPVLGHLVQIAEFLMSSSMVEENDGEAAIPSKEDAQDEEETQNKVSIDNASTPTRNAAHDTYLKDLVAASKSGDKWISFLCNEMQVYLDMLRHFSSPSKGNDTEEGASFDGPTPSFNIDCASVNITNTANAPMADDSDEEDEAAQEKDQDKPGSPSEDMDLFANFDKLAVSDTPAEESAESTTDENGAGVPDPFSDDGDPFSSDDPFDDVTIPPPTHSPDDEQSQQKGDDPFGAVTDFEDGTSGKTEDTQSIPTNGADEHSSKSAVSVEATTVAVHD